MQFKRAHWQRLPHLSRSRPTEIGKRVGWSDGTVGPAIVSHLVETTTIAQETELAYINVDIFRMGEATAMVDSGAKRSAIRADLIANRNSFPIRNSSSCWRTADGGIARNVVGETSLTIRYKGHVVELPRVVVMNNLAPPFILGIEWVDAMRAAVTTKDGKGVVTFKKQENSKSSEAVMKERSPRQPDNITLEGPERDWSKIRNEVSSRTTFRRSFAYIQFVLDLPAERVSREKRAIGKSGYTSDDYITQKRIIHELEPIGECPRHEEFVFVNGDIGKDLTNIGIASIIEATSKRHVRPPPRAVLKPEKEITDPARHQKFVTPRPSSDEQSIVSSAKVKGKGKQRVSSFGLVRRKDKVVRVTITNSRKSVLRWIGSKTVTWKKETYDSGTNEIQTLAIIQPEGYDNPEKKFELNAEENYQAKLCEGKNGFISALGIAYDRYLSGLIWVARRDKDFIYQPPRSENTIFAITRFSCLVLFVLSAIIWARIVKCLNEGVINFDFDLIVSHYYFSLLRISYHVCHLICHK